VAETPAERAEAVKAVASATSEASEDVQRLAMQAVVPPPTQTEASRLWFILVVGLLVLAAISLGGMVYLLADGSDKTDPDAALTAFTTLLAGLLGLFAPKPSASQARGPDSQ
jgi:hypothetical protein